MFRNVRLNAFNSKSHGEAAERQIALDPAQSARVEWLHGIREAANGPLEGEDLIVFQQEIAIGLAEIFMPDEFQQVGVFSFSVLWDGNW
jgi:hypothetical protein